MTEHLSPPLRWRDLGTTNASWLPLHPFPAHNEGFFEGNRYAFENPGSGWSMRIDDAPLQIDPTNRSDWYWTPGFFAGEVTAELLGPDASSCTLYMLDVAPHPGKLGRETFARMVEELWNADPALVIGSEPATTLIGSLGTVRDIWLEFARFRRYVPEFLRALNGVLANPRRTLAVRRIASPLHTVRRVDGRTAVALARSPAVAALLSGRDAKTTSSDDCRLDVPFIEESLDAAANRAMHALVLAVIRRGFALVDLLEQLVETEPDSETRTSLRVRWPVRRTYLCDSIDRLQRTLRRSPFPEVRRAEITAAGLTAVSADPAYARAWGLGWRALRHGLESGEKLERLWVSPSWEIYERWCFLRLGQTLSKAMPNWNWVRLADRWVGINSTGRAELRLQPSFRSRSEESIDPWSISKHRVPDILFTLETGRELRFVVLDAKYRSSRSNVLDAMESAHIYQDSLRIGPARPEASLLLVPAGGGASWLEDAEFQDKHRVGVHVLSPEADAPLPTAIRRMLNRSVVSNIESTTPPIHCSSR
jgi:hypothetical protein